MFLGKTSHQKYSVIFLILCTFAVIRPITTISFFATHQVLGITLSEIFSLGSSYLFLVLILFHLKELRLDGIGLFILFFCSYCVLSILWGSSVREILRLILPALVFFMVRITVREKWQIKHLLLLMIIGYIIPILGSALLISLGKTMYMTIYWTGLERYSGMYLKIHTLAHAMFVFLATFLFYLDLDRTDQHKKRLLVYSCYFLAMLSVYNLYCTYTRTVFVGLAILGIFNLLGRRSYKTLIVALLVMLTIVVTSSHFQTIFFDVYEPLQGEGDISKMGSGRIGRWSSMVRIFGNSSFETKLIGFGAGGSLNGSPFTLALGHSDLFSLFFSLGVIGLLSYLSLVVKVFLDMVKSGIMRPMKYTLLGFLLAALAMNFLSNSYLVRFEIAQYFFLVIGFFSVLNELSHSEVRKCSSGA